jgi:16S rRNA (adenine1518-N6/adenine1519-N6)-dimethyltransferase
MSCAQLELLLRARGFHFVKSLGQNFLMDEERLAFIAERSGATGRAVLEIGAGAGCLTKALAPLAERVLAIEIDRNLIPILETVLSPFQNVKILQGDALRLKLEPLCAKELGEGFIVAANLPYGITSEIMLRLFALRGAESITVLLQKEAIERILCGPGSREYGPISILREYFFESEILGEIGPESFLPEPSVTSSILRLVRREGGEPCQEEALRDLLRAAFAARRKTLHNNLSPLLGREGAAEAIQGAGLPAGIRAEAVPLDSFLLLCGEIAKLPPHV